MKLLITEVSLMSRHRLAIYLGLDQQIQVCRLIAVLLIVAPLYRDDLALRGARALERAASLPLANPAESAT